MLNYVMQTGEVNKALSLFSRLFDLRIAFFDANDAELFFFDVKERSSYCRQIRGKATLCPLCEQSDLTQLAKARQSGQSIIYHCHRELFEAVVPLFDAAGGYLGALMFGQLRDSSRPPPAQPSTKLQNEFGRLPEMPPERVREIAALLRYISTAIIEKAWLKRCRENWASVLEEYMNDHIRDVLTIQTLARAVNCSQSFLSHNFKNVFGLSPMRYILRKRLELARERLLEGYRAFEVAREFSFFDQYHFSRAFRKQYGYPPRQTVQHAQHTAGTPRQ